LIGDVVRGCVEDVREAGRRGDALLGVRTGLTELDRLTNGWQPGNLVIVAGRPGMGKTAFALSCAKAVAEPGLPAVVYSIEMPARELGHRLIASEANIPHQKWVSAKGLQVDEAKRAEAAILKVRSWPL